MLRAEHLTRRFGSRVAVDNVSFELVPGEIFALLGPNGAGKTTTLRMLAGLIEPTSGTVQIGSDGNPQHRGPRLRRRIGFLTETPGLWERLTVRDNLLVYARLHGLRDPAKAVARALEDFEMTGRAGDPAIELSKGLKQRVALARTLLHEPDVVLLDEPTSGLDPESARDVRELVLRLRNEQRTVLLSTHNLDEVERVANRVAVLRTRLVAVDTPAALRTRVFGARVKVVIGQSASSFVNAVSNAGFHDVRTDEHELSVGITDYPSSAPVIIRSLVEAGADVLSVVAEHPPLEEVYLRLLEEDA